MKCKRLVFVVMLCAMTTLFGCASFRNNELADVGKLPEVSQFTNKPSVFVDARLYRGEPGSGETEALTAKNLVQEIIGNSLNESGMFSKYSFDAADKAASDYSMEVNVYNHGNIPLAAIAGFISGFTFGVIPAAATDNYTLQIKLTDKSGTVMSAETNKDSITTWVGLWFIPVMANTPNKAFAGTLNNQFQSVLKKLFESGKLKYSSFSPYSRPGTA